jgi:hypothetical protein
MWQVGLYVSNAFRMTWIYSRFLVNKYKWITISSNQTTTKIEIANLSIKGYTSE